jgi:hypothetical protein
MTQIEKYNNARYEAYKEFLLRNNANPEILELKAVQDIIKDVIKNGDHQVIFEGRSPISYEMPNEDGTFNIVGRTNGPVANIVYYMSYCKDNDAFIKLKKRSINQAQYFMDIELDEENEDIYISREGNIIDKGIAKIKKI